MRVQVTLCLDSLLYRAGGVVGVGIAFYDYGRSHLAMLLLTSFFLVIVLLFVAVLLPRRCRHLTPPLRLRLQIQVGDGIVWILASGRRNPLLSFALFS